MHKNIKLTSPDMVAGAFFFLLVLISKASILSLPFYWDEMGAYIMPSHWLVQGSFLRIIPGFHPPYLFYGHPPGLYVTLGIVYKAFGESIWISHLLAIGFSFLGVFFTYLLAMRLHDRTTGIISALLLFFSPVYFAQSGLVQADLFITALGIMCIYFVFQEKYLAYLICSLYLVTVKESSIAIIVSLLIYLYITDKNSHRRKIKMIKYAIPLFAIGIFFILQKITINELLPNPFFTSHAFMNLSPLSLASKLYDVLKWSFYSQGRIVLTALIIASFLIKKRYAWKNEFSIFLFLFLFFIGTFSAVFYLPRYILPILPYFYILGAYSIILLVKDKRVQVLMVSAILILSVGRLHGTTSTYGTYDRDMQYADVVWTHKEACHYAERYFFDKRILALWPLAPALKEPYLGYVKKPLNVVSLGEEYDVVIYTPQGDLRNEKLKDLIREKQLLLDKTFAKKGKSVEIYTFY
jgi:4-amino-4-deoxy-L-arabinose transferase-like glycosyltransferase